jgi:hypothetical protein
MGHSPTVCSMTYWFQDEDAESSDRRKNRLRRIAHESQEQEEGQIDRWLDLAKKAFDGDDDPNSSVA